MTKTVKSTLAAILCSGSLIAGAAVADTQTGMSGMDGMSGMNGMPGMSGNWTPPSN
ncbi:hypothetical protein [Profundibacter sp.]